MGFQNICTYSGVYIQSIYICHDTRILWSHSTQLILGKIIPFESAASSMWRSARKVSLWCRIFILYVTLGLLPPTSKLPNGVKHFFFSQTRRRTSLGVWYVHVNWTCDRIWYGGWAYTLPASRTSAEIFSLSKSRFPHQSRSSLPGSLRGPKGKPRWRCYLDHECA